MTHSDSNEVEIQRWRQLLLKLESLPVTEFDFERESKEWALLLEAYDRFNSNADRESGILGLPKCYKKNEVTDSTTAPTGSKPPMPANAKEYVALFKLDKPVEDPRMIVGALGRLRAVVLQAPAFIQTALRICTVHESKLVTYDRRTGIGVVWFIVEAGTLVNRICVCIGFLIGVNVQMLDILKNKAVV